jgi:hypothetical protein
MKTTLISPFLQKNLTNVKPAAIDGAEIVLPDFNNSLIELSPISVLSIWSGIIRNRRPFSPHYAAAGRHPGTATQ